MGVVSVTTFSTDTETVTKTKLNGLAANLVTEFNGSIDNANIKAAAGIDLSKLDFAAADASITWTLATTSANLIMNNTGDGPQLRFTGDPTVASPTDGDLWFTGSALNFRNGAATVNLLTIFDTATTTGFSLDGSGHDALTSGGIVEFESDSSDTTARTLVSIINNNTAAVNATCLKVQQDSTEEAIDVDINSVSPGLNIDQDTAEDALTLGIVINQDNSTDATNCHAIRFLGDMIVEAAVAGTQNRSLRVMIDSVTYYIPANTATA